MKKLLIQIAGLLLGVVTLPYGVIKAANVAKDAIKEGSKAWRL